MISGTKLKVTSGGMSAFYQSVEGPEQFLYVVEVEAGGGLVEDKQFGCRVAAGDQV